MATQVSSKPTRKVVAQAIVTIVAFIAIRFLGVEIDVATQGALATLIQVLLEGGLAGLVGFIVAYFTPPSEKDGIER